jgi:hypothetical protein
MIGSASRPPTITHVKEEEEEEEEEEEKTGSREGLFSQK